MGREPKVLPQSRPSPNHDQEWGEEQAIKLDGGDRQTYAQTYSLPLDLRLSPTLLQPITDFSIGGGAVALPPFEQRSTTNALAVLQGSELLATKRDNCINNFKNTGFSFAKV